MRATAVLPYAAQTEWSATATLPLGPPETRIGPARPRNVVVTALKDGVMRSRSPRAPSATQTESLPVATPVGAVARPAPGGGRAERKRGRHGPLARIDAREGLVVLVANPDRSRAD